MIFFATIHLACLWLFLDMCERAQGSWRNSVRTRRRCACRHLRDDGGYNDAGQYHGLVAVMR